jgi:hypothetical protein
MVHQYDFQPKFCWKSTHMTPQSQWNSSLSIQWCLLDPYGRVKVVGSCLLVCPCGCQWPQKFYWLMCDDGVHHYVISNPSFAENQPHMTPQSK